MAHVHLLSRVERHRALSPTELCNTCGAQDQQDEGGVAHERHQLGPAIPVRVHVKRLTIRRALRQNSVAALAKRAVRNLLGFLVTRWHGSKLCLIGDPQETIRHAHGRFGYHPHSGLPAVERADDYAKDHKDHQHSEPQRIVQVISPPVQHLRQCAVASPASVMNWSSVDWNSCVRAASAGLTVPNIAASASAIFSTTANFIEQKSVQITSIRYAEVVFEPGLPESSGSALNRGEPFCAACLCDWGSALCHKELTRGIWAA